MGHQTYPFGIFGSTVIATTNPEGSLKQNIGHGPLRSVFYIPGSLIGGYLMDRIGRKQTMSPGFVIWSVYSFIIGASLQKITVVFPLFVVMYGSSKHQERWDLG